MDVCGFLFGKPQTVESEATLSWLISDFLSVDFFAKPDVL